MNGVFFCVGLLVGFVLACAFISAWILEEAGMVALLLLAAMLSGAVMHKLAGLCPVRKAAGEEE